MGRTLRKSQKDRRSSEDLQKRLSEAVARGMGKNAKPPQEVKVSAPDKIPDWKKRKSEHALPRPPK
jgi:hypothetical protein